MAKVVYASLKKAKAVRVGSHSKTSLSSKTITAPDGSKVKISTVDADSPTFSHDLTAAFKRNVARARQENRRIRDQVDAVGSES